MIAVPRIESTDTDGSISWRLADWCRGDRDLAPPAHVLEQARLCIADFLSSALTVDIAERTSMAWHAVGRPTQGPATILGTSYRAAADAAAFVNATSAASTSRSDTFAESATHPGMTIIPAVLALCEERGLSLERLLCSTVVGYETMARLARALIVPKTSSRFRPSGLVGAASAAAGCAHAIGLGRAGTAHAISIAAQTLSGLNQWAGEGTTDHVHHVAYAASNGVRSALLAEAGAGAPSAIFEGRSGLLQALELEERAHLLTMGLGEAYEILNVVFKPAPVCMYAQVPVQAAARIVDQGQLDPRPVRKVEIRTFQMAIAYPGCDNAGPIGSFQDAKQSIQFSVAAVLNAGGIFDESWKNFTDAETTALAAKATLTEDAGMTAAFPERLGAGIEIRFEDGTTRNATLDDLVTMDCGAILDRLSRVASPRLGAASVSRVIDLLHEAEADCTELASLLRRNWTFQPVSP